MQKNIFFEIALSIFLIILSIFNGRINKMEQKVSEKELPERLGIFNGVNISLGEEEKGFVVSSGVRILKSQYGKYIVTLISSAGRPNVLHSPRVCYEASGYLVYNEEIVSFTPSLKTVKLTLIKNNSKETLYYWFFNNKIKTTDFSNVFFSSITGQNKWNLITVIFPGEDNIEIKNFIIYLEGYFSSKVE